MRYISYQTAEIHCEQLAQKIRLQLGPDLERTLFVPIPRGGLIVLGMLSYLLDLRREQIVSQVDFPSQPVVVVDDCALSGARFAAHLENLHAQKVIFAHLLSHPELRRAICAQEPRVIACLAAADLADPAEPPSRYSVPPEKHHLLPGKRYWLGPVEHLLFAWSEPDMVIWNERAQRIETWHAASPSLCLEARGLLGIPLAIPHNRKLDIPQKVFWRTRDDTIFLWRQTSDQVFGLQDISSAMWRALIAYGEIEAAADYLVTQYQVEPDILLHDLRAFARQLLDKGLLVELS
jgi:hypothetical protein